MDILLPRGAKGGEGKTGNKEKGEEGKFLLLPHSILPAIPSVWNVFLSFYTGLILCLQIFLFLMQLALYG